MPARPLSRLITRRWKEKIAVVVLAFFFWNMIKQQIREPRARDYSDFIREHSIQNAAGLDKPSSGL